MTKFAPLVSSLLKTSMGQFNLFMEKASANKVRLAEKKTSKANCKGSRARALQAFFRPLCSLNTRKVLSEMYAGLEGILDNAVK